MQAGGSCELLWATCAFLAASCPMTSMLACEFHMLPKACAWPNLLVMARGVSDALGCSKGSGDCRGRGQEFAISLYSHHRSFEKRSVVISTS